MNTNFNQFQQAAASAFSTNFNPPPSGQ